MFVISKQLALGITLAQGAVPTKDQPPVVPMVGPTSTVAGAELDLPALESAMTRMVSDICAAQDPEDLDWLLGEQIAGGPLQSYYQRLFAALPHFSKVDLDVTVDELDPVLRELVPMFLVSMNLLTSMSATLDEDQRSELNELLFGISRHGLDLQEMLYAEGTAPAIQAALYDGQAAYLCLLVLLDERPRPAWLDTELRRRALDGQRHHLRLLVALARERGLQVPDTGPLSSLEPFDLEHAEHEGELQRKAVDAYLDSIRDSFDRS